MFQVLQEIRHFNVSGVEFVYDLGCASSVLFASLWAFTLFFDLEGGFAAPAVLTLGLLMRWFDVLGPPTPAFPSVFSSLSDRAVALFQE